MSGSLSQVTEETLATIAKAQTTGILEPTGIYSYDLSELVTLIPVVTPFRDIVARNTSPDGNPYAVWRAIMNINNRQPDPVDGFRLCGQRDVYLRRAGLPGPVQADRLRGRGHPGRV